ncbi:hypothetical protein HQ545_08290 [Candidatus Woesearchaeota archaeon]|nr:hypothetical protein [Candidatus Woesearchaeota archaeon]
MALNQLLVKPLEKLRTRIITIPVTCLQSELDAVTMFYTDTISTLTHDDEKSWKTGYGTDKPFMPEDNDRKILAECVKIHTSENIALLSNDRAFVFPKFKEQIESKFGILIECL